MRDLMKCSGKFYVVQVSMTQQSGDFKELLFTTITHNRGHHFLTVPYLYLVITGGKMVS